MNSLRYFLISLRRVEREKEREHLDRLVKVLLINTGLLEGDVCEVWRSSEEGGKEVWREG